MCSVSFVGASNEILNIKIVVDTATLENFLTRLVRVTEDFTIEKLLQLYSVLQQCVYNHRRELDKKNLLKVSRNSTTFPWFEKVSSIFF